MYAVILAGGKQHRVKEGEILSVEKIESLTGEQVQFDKVLMLVNGEQVTVGQPFIEGATVSAVVVEQYRAPKIRIIKFRRRKHHMKHMGHRQYYTQVKIVKING